MVDTTNISSCRHVSKTPVFPQSAMTFIKSIINVRIHHSMRNLITTFVDSTHYAECRFKFSCTRDFTIAIHAFIGHVERVRMRMYYGSGTAAHTLSQWRHNRRASGRVAGTAGQPATSAAYRCLFCVTWCHGRHLESMTSNEKNLLVSRCVFTWRALLPNFIPIRFETKEY